MPASLSDRRREPQNERRGLDKYVERQVRVDFPFVGSDVLALPQGHRG